MALARIRTGDQVVVIAGKDRGRTGKVKSVDVKQGRVVVEGINIVKRHTRPTGLGKPGGIIEQEAPLHISNVMLADKQGRPVRTGVKVQEDGTRVRVSKRTGEVIQ